MTTIEYRRLERDLGRLRAQFLDFSPRFVGDYRDYELLNCRAFVTFSHAEFEHYLEEIARKMVIRARKRWSNRRSMGRVLSSLLTFKKSELVVAEKIKEQQPKYRLESAINQVLAEHTSLISNNNGIRQKNFSQLFTPIGIDPDEVDDILVSLLDDFGKRRGGLVHAGNSVSLSRIRDPFTEESRDVANLLTELRKFDEYSSSVS
jgi:hypothetical protein